jgi:uracil phosphoribosyltransferase
MLHVVNHPLIAHKMTHLREKDTCSKEFRELVSEIGTLMSYEALRDLPLTTKEIETPICRTLAPTLATNNLTIVPILRAGLGLVDGVLRIVPTARIGHIGLRRNEETLKPEQYMCKLPEDIASSPVMIVDPMLATGGSASAAVTLLKEKGCKHIKLMVLLAAPEGVQRMEQDHPDVTVYCGALDEKLNEKGYIVPGLGDAGDRIFGTV